MPERLNFGLNAAVPEGTAVAWGARLIFPDDLLWDRQSWIGDEDQRAPTVEWLNGGALKSALARAREMAERGELVSSDSRPVVLHEDEQGTIAGDPRGSHGYLYVAGWLH